MAHPDTTDTTAEVHSYRARVAEHGRFRAVMESFAYLPPFGGLFKKTSPFYAESYWYCMGGITFLMFVYLTISGILLAWLGPFWWLTSPVGKALKGSHYWAAQAFFFHLFSPANFSADLAIHVAVIPVILFGLIMAHLTLVRLQGIARPL